MAREQFTGTLIHTQTRADGPMGKPITQALFHTVDDQTPAVAIWHGGAEPAAMATGQTYAVTGDYIQHKDRHLFFKPVVEAVEQAIQPERLRRLLFRPRDWRRTHQVIAAISLTMAVLVAGLVISFASGDSRQYSQPATEPVASRQSEQAGTVAAAGTKAPVSNPENNAPADCVSRISVYPSITRTDASLPAGQRRLVTPGVTGTTQVCYPNGRAQPAVETVTRQPVTEIIAVGNKRSAPVAAAPAPALTPPPAPTPPEPAAPEPATEELAPTAPNVDDENQ